MTENTILLESGTNELEVIEFHLSSGHDSQARMTHYAINVTKVLEIIRQPPITSMPNTVNSCVLGTFNYRGRKITDFVDVAVLDIEMPRRDGFSLCKAIKEDPVLQDIVVIMFSSMITDRVTHKCQAVGADGQVSKPDIGRIRETISEHLPESEPVSFWNAPGSQS